MAVVLLQVLEELDVLRLEDEINDRPRGRWIRQEESMRRRLVVHYVKAAHDFGNELHLLAVVDLIELALHVLAPQHEHKSLELVELLPELDVG